jgi:hypothetical protein
VHDAAVARGDREMHEADRFSGRRAARSRDACDGHRQIHIGMLERAERHGGRGFLADSTEGF